VLDTRYFRSDLMYKSDVLDDQNKLFQKYADLLKTPIEGADASIVNEDGSCTTPSSLSADRDVIPEWCRTPFDDTRAGMYCAFTEESIDLARKIRVLNNAEKRHPRQKDDKNFEFTVPTMLGSGQWEWLEKQLSVPNIDLRIIASSITVLPTYNGLENWGLFPLERQRLVDMVVGSIANKEGEERGPDVVFLSGDVHYAEISKVDVVLDNLENKEKKNDLHVIDTTNRNTAQSTKHRLEQKDDNDNDASAADTQPTSTTNSNTKYSLYEFTSSGLTMSESGGALEVMPNFNRLEGTSAFGGPGYNNWGLLELIFDGATSRERGPTLSFHIMNDHGEAIEGTSMELSGMKRRLKQ
jgi:hypothetical protein